ncbi:hypothetical protein N9L68_01800 [bacterium]|nr:hypothetical protein [bacterium]
MKRWQGPDAELLFERGEELVEESSSSTNLGATFAPEVVGPVLNVAMTGA